MRIVESLRGFVRSCSGGKAIDRAKVEDHSGKSITLNGSETVYTRPRKKPYVSPLAADLEHAYGREYNEELSRKVQIHAVPYSSKRSEEESRAIMEDQRRFREKLEQEEKKLLKGDE